MNERTCSNCIYGVRDSFPMECHKNAPAVYKSEYFPHETRWPKVNQHEWCGQHELREGPLQ